MIIHGGKYGTKHVAKCGKYRNKIEQDGELCLYYIDGIKRVNCPECLRKHNPNKC